MEDTEIFINTRQVVVSQNQKNALKGCFIKDI